MTTCGGVLSEALLTGRSGWMRCSLRRTSPLLSSHPRDIHSHFKLFSFIHHTLNPLLSLELFLFFIYSSCYPLTHPSILACHALFFLSTFLCPSSLTFYHTVSCFLLSHLSHIFSVSTSSLRVLTPSIYPLSLHSQLFSFPYWIRSIRNVRDFRYHKGFCSLANLGALCKYVGKRDNKLGPLLTLSSIHVIYVLTCHYFLITSVIQVVVMKHTHGEHASWFVLNVEGT